MDRRRFLTLGAATVIAGTRGLISASAQQFDKRPSPDTPIPWGETRLGLTDDFRDGTLYVPKSYEDGKRMPVLVMLHGLGGAAARSAFPLAEEFGVIVIAPESRQLAWGSAPGFDDDAKYIGAAYRYVTQLLDCDPTHVALGGISDGATYALSMGLAYGDVFNHLMIFAAGIPTAVRRRGKPRIFVGHGTQDHQMPIEDTARNWGPKLKAEGYDITIREHPGGHGAPPDIMREAFEWFLQDRKAGN